MPFCPSCHAEYTESALVCPECNASLVPRLDPGETTDMVDVYRCYNEQLAERMRVLFEENGLEALVRDQKSRDFPTSIGAGASQMVAVRAAEVETARRVVREAV